jgi:hypothetical protein
MAIASIISLLFVLQALCYFEVAYWAGSMFRSAGATWIQSFNAGGGDWWIGILYLVVAAVYWKLFKLRTGIEAIGVMLGFYGAWTLYQNRNFFVSWNIMHGDIIAISRWGTSLLVVLGLFSVLALVLRTRKRQPAS